MSNPFIRVIARAIAHTDKIAEVQPYYKKLLYLFDSKQALGLSATKK